MGACALGSAERGGSLLHSAPSFLAALASQGTGQLPLDREQVLTNGGPYGAVGPSSFVRRASPGGYFLQGERMRWYLFSGFRYLLISFFIAELCSFLAEC